MRDLAQLINSLLVPGDWLVVLLAIGAMLLWTRWQRFGRVVVAVSATLFLILAIVPFHIAMRSALESRFPIPSDLPANVAGILVLGGSSDPGLTRRTGYPNLGESVERLVVAADLSARYPAARVVIAGGVGLPDLREADVEGGVLTQLGVPHHRLVLERSSRNTHENVVESKRLVAPASGDHWILVTSAVHMPRAVGVVRRQGWQMIPFPVDHSLAPGLGWSGRTNFNLSRNLSRLGGALHEWVGLIAYRLLGRTESWFPGPQQ